VVQLGSFGNSDNARRLRDHVREKGYGSHLQEVVRGDTTLTRVFSGPFATKSEAESAKRALDDAFGLNSLVTSGEK
jgi:DedD protein